MALSPAFIGSFFRTHGSIHPQYSCRDKVKQHTVFLTLFKRQTQFDIIHKFRGKDKKSSNQTVSNLRNRAGDIFSIVFKTIMYDNGSNVSGLHQVL